MAFNEAPRDIGQDGWPAVRTFARAIASVVNRINRGKLNCVYDAAGDLTLTANAASTTLTDARLGIGSFVSFMPMTANAAAEIGAGTLFVTSANMNNGAWVLSHANNAQTDRTYRVLILG